MTSKVVDFAKPKLPPAAKPMAMPSLAGMASQMPLAEGVVKMQRLSPEEAKRLQELGVPPSMDVLPQNLLELTDAVKDRVLVEMPIENLSDDEEGLLETLDRTKGMSPVTPEEIDVRDLPPPQRKMYESLLATVLSNTKQQATAAAVPEGMAKSVHSAVMAANAPTVVNDVKSSSYSTGVTKEQSVAPDETATPVAGKQEERHRICARCGFPKDKLEDIEVSEEDKSAFYQALICMVPFVRTVKIFGGSGSVTVRTLSTHEIDQIFRQVNLDGRLGRISSFAEEVEFTARFRLALQLVDITTPQSRITFPKSIDEWPEAPPQPEGGQELGRLGFIWSQVNPQIGANEAFYRVLSDIVARFNVAVQKMERLVQQPDFWKAIGT